MTGLAQSNPTNNNSTTHTISFCIFYYLCIIECTLWGGSLVEGFPKRQKLVRSTAQNTPCLKPAGKKDCVVCGFLFLLFFEGHRESLSFIFFINIAIYNTCSIQNNLSFEEKHAMNSGRVVDRTYQFHFSCLSSFWSPSVSWLEY